MFSFGTHVVVARTCLWIFLITISRSACVSFQVEAVGGTRVVSSFNSICTTAAAWKSLATRSSPVSENDDDGELTSRRMRLFPKLRPSHLRVAMSMHRGNVLFDWFYGCGSSSNSLLNSEDGWRSCL